MTSVRMNKWLWAARFFRTRGLAARACELGRIQSNGQPAKAAREVRIGDLLRVTNDGCGASATSLLEFLTIFGDLGVFGNLSHSASSACSASIPAARSAGNAEATTAARRITVADRAKAARPAAECRECTCRSRAGRQSQLQFP